MTNNELVGKLKDISENYKTTYVWGTFGLVANSSNMQRMITQYSTNSSYLSKAQKIYGNGYFFDCVGLIKGVLWGWNGSKNSTYGGAIYTSNGVPDINADTMMTKCTNISTNFSNITVGEAVWMSGHIGIYIGNGKVVESTPAWSSGVQISDISVSGKRSKNGIVKSAWKKHGKLPYITYESENKKMLNSGNDIVWELMNGSLKVEIQEVERAVKALDKAKTSSEFSSLYWIIWKIVNNYSG